eukprot:1193072-Prorocentrum_minimum.AAC.1
MGGEGGVTQRGAPNLPPLPPRDWSPSQEYALSPREIGPTCRHPRLDRRDQYQLSPRVESQGEEGWPAQEYVLSPRGIGHLPAVEERYPGNMIGHPAMNMFSPLVGLVTYPRREYALSPCGIGHLPAVEEVAREHERAPAEGLDPVGLGHLLAGVPELVEKGVLDGHNHVPHHQVPKGLQLKRHLEPKHGESHASGSESAPRQPIVCERFRIGSPTANRVRA